MKNNVIYYGVGPLLYCPANKKSVVSSIINEKFGKHFSLAMCLEDSVNDNQVSQAEADLLLSLKEIYAARQSKDFYLPKIFVRVRNAAQIMRLYSGFGECAELVAGFIFPKFSLENVDSYINQIKSVNERSLGKVYMMPIYESSSIIDLRKRTDIFYGLKEKLSSVEELVLNIRVGGNDLSHAFGFRRHNDESIHSIVPVANIFSDIITVYGTDYVVSGPVWEYYSGKGWDTGLAAEIKDDILAGFTGKTVIHPNQIDVVNEGYKVSRTDYEDALAISNWNSETGDYVLGSSSGERMNEYKTHINWAEKTLYLAQVFGVRD